MELWRTREGGFFGVYDHWQGLIVDIDGIDGITSHVAVFGDDHGHRFAHKAHHTIGDGTRGIHVVFEATRWPCTRQRIDVEHIAPDDNVDNTRHGLSLADVDGGDPGMGVGTPQHGSMCHAGEFDVIEKVAMAGDE